MLVVGIHGAFESAVAGAVLADSGPAGVLGWSLVLIVMLVGAFWAIARLRAWLKQEDAPVSVGFSLTDLRALHRAGKMTDDEFEKARSLMVAHAKHVAERMPHPLAGSKLRGPGLTAPGAGDPIAGPSAAEPRPGGAGAAPDPPARGPDP